MKVLHVVPHIHKEGSGPSYSVPRLCKELCYEILLAQNVLGWQLLRLFYIIRYLRRGFNMGVYN